jgi:hypothetical protein
MLAAIGAVAVAAAAAAAGDAEHKIGFEDRDEPAEADDAATWKSSLSSLSSS